VETAYGFEYGFIIWEGKGWRGGNLGRDSRLYTMDERRGLSASARTLYIQNVYMMNGDQTKALASAISSFLFPKKRFQTPPAKEGPNSFDMVG
jgi:hypothetical protein